MNAPDNLQDNLQDTPPDADICLLLEGTYPYVPGGVSGWTHELIRMHPQYRFALVALVPAGGGGRARPAPVFDLPDNVVSLTTVPLQDLPPGVRRLQGGRHAQEHLGKALDALLDAPSLPNLAALVEVLRAHPGMGAQQLLNHRTMWTRLRARYDRTMPHAAFLDYFWSWRALLGGLYSILLAPLPRATLYHALSTGYAGLMLARARVETQRPCLITEHGIYTNERRIEIAAADWLSDARSPVLDVSGIAGTREVREFWAETFGQYAQLAYAAADRIVTLYADNQDFQRMDGAEEAKLMVIPNGIDVPRFAALRPEGAEARGEHPPTVALIGRVVPIKDVKTYIRAVALLREQVPNVRALMLGPEDEDPAYAEECRALVRYLRLEGTLTFTGRADLMQYLPHIDIAVLTSISEAQPLVILEAGAAGIPTVATDVGSCREILHGAPTEDPPLGPGGIITPLADPAAVAQALAELLADPARYAACSAAIRQRVARYYHRDTQQAAYDALYGMLLGQGGVDAG